MESGIDPGQEYGQDYYSYEHGYIFSFSYGIVLYYFKCNWKLLLLIEFIFKTSLSPFYI